LKHPDGHDRSNGLTAAERCMRDVRSGPRRPSSRIHAGWLRSSMSLCRIRAHVDVIPLGIAAVQYSTVINRITLVLDNLFY
jgi:hypothetical protein